MERETLLQSVSVVTIGRYVSLDLAGFTLYCKWNLSKNDANRKQEKNQEMERVCLKRFEHLHPVMLFTVISLLYEAMYFPLIFAEAR